MQVLAQPAVKTGKSLGNIVFPGAIPNRLLLREVRWKVWRPKADIFGSARYGGGFRPGSADGDLDGRVLTRVVPTAGVLLGESRSLVHERGAERLAVLGDANNTRCGSREYCWKLEAGGPIPHHYASSGAAVQRCRSRAIWTCQPIDSTAVNDGFAPPLKRLLRVP